MGWNGQEVVVAGRDSVPLGPQAFWLGALVWRVMSAHWYRGCGSRNRSEERIEVLIPAHVVVKNWGEKTEMGSDTYGCAAEVPAGCGFLWTQSPH